ncbi:alpha/beta fold hydrolase [Actinoplanes sp. NPDC051470]|uniref:thioesterase II family protein n=1 Tax=unclassified Actinoplanes TaxID=2626549 RepID=UPI0034448C88
MAVRSEEWTTVFHRRPGGPYRLVFFPHAGGSAGAAAPLAAAAPPSVEVVTMQYPGRQWRRAEPAAADLRELARSAARALLSTPETPTVLFGHSMGAIVAFETTLLLDEVRPGLVSRLFASGSGAPTRPRRMTLTPEAGDDDLVEELRRMGGTDEALLADPEALMLMLPPLRHDYRLMTAYSVRPGARVIAPITALFGEDDEATPPDAAAAWAGHTDGDFELRTFPGGHFYLGRRRREVIDSILRHFPASEASWRTAI